MFFPGINTYLKFLSRQKVYTFVSVAGFAVSLAFVIILSLYAKTQVSMDSFHENKERLFMLAHENGAHISSPVGPYVKDLLPEVESYVRLAGKLFRGGPSHQGRQEIYVMMADANFFEVFSFPLLEGDPADPFPSSDIALISATTAAKFFGNDNPLGRTVVIEDNEFVVGGIYRDFPYNTHLENPDVILNYNEIERVYGWNILDNWGDSSYSTYLLARRGADLPSKSEFLREQFMENYWMYYDGFVEEVRLIPVEDIYFTGLTSSLKLKSGSLDNTRMYLGLAVLILIVALLNYINMTVAQSGFRGKEAAVRKLMGSGRGRIVVQILSESFLMTTIALVLALLIAFLFEGYFNDLLGTTLNLRGQFQTGTVLWFIVCLIGLSLAAGILPALAVSTFRPIEVVKGTVARKVKTGYSKVLIVFQFTVCAALLVCTFVLRGQADYLVSRDVGFNRENIIQIRNKDFGRGEVEGVRNRLRAIAGVDAVGFSHWSLLDGGSNYSFAINDVPVSLQMVRMDSTAFDIYGFRIRPLTGMETNDLQSMAYLNETAYNIINSDGNTFQFRFSKDSDTYNINGIVENFHIRPLHETSPPAMIQYLPEGLRVTDFVVKVNSDDVFETASKIVEVYSEMTGGDFADITFADERILSWYENERRMARVMGTFTLLSIVIMVMGVFAMSLYMIRQKEKEIGVRKVNGATVGEVLRMLNLQSLGRVAVALVIAWPVAYIVMERWLRGFAYRQQIGVWPFITAGLVVTALCLVSVSWQTLRAARANPVESLKSE
ncbi:MAG: ABC transporter permease [Alistipes sp.]|nr:ABC transporter permease [Alistipes sp.]